VVGLPQGEGVAGPEAEQHQRLGRRRLVLQPDTVVAVGVAQHLLGGRIEEALGGVTDHAGLQDRLLGVGQQAPDDLPLSVADRPVDRRVIREGAEPLSQVVSVQRICHRMPQEGLWP